MRDCRWEGTEADGGRYEVCVADYPWLVGQVMQANLRCGGEREMTCARLQLRAGVLRLLVLQLLLF